MSGPRWVMLAPARRRAFALVLVVLLALAAAALVTVLLTRRATATVAVKRQSDSYVAHHMQAGLREFIPVFLQTSTRKQDALLAGAGTPDGAPLGFDLGLEGGLKLEVRLRDLGGSVLMSKRPGGSVRLTVMARAGLILTERGLIGMEFMRVYGPPRISLHGARREVLVALAEAIEQGADGGAFADEVIETRNKRNLTAADPRAMATKAKLAGTKLDMLEALVSVDPSYWWIEARVLNQSGREIMRQGGFASGSLGGGLGAGGAVGGSGGGGGAGWVIESWTELPRNTPFASALRAVAEGAGRTQAGQVEQQPGAPAR